MHLLSETMFDILRTQRFEEVHHLLRILVLVTDNPHQHLCHVLLHQHHSNNNNNNKMLVDIDLLSHRLIEAVMLDLAQLNVYQAPNIKSLHPLLLQYLQVEGEPEVDQDNSKVEEALLNNIVMAALIDRHHRSRYLIYLLLNNNSNNNVYILSNLIINSTNNTINNN